MSNFTDRRGRLSARVLVLLALLIASIPTIKAAPKAELIEFWDDREPLSTMQVNHGQWQEILSTYVDDQHPSGVNRFDYSAVTAGDARKLKDYLSYMQQMEPRQLNGEEAKAYWINLFNAILVDKVVDAYQSGSTRAVNRLLNGGLRSAAGWRRDAVEVVMQDISLNDIEHGILRPIWKDPRIHFAISACTLGGANIQKTAFNGENNEELLEKAKAEFFEHPRAVRVDDGRIILNSVFDWYTADFAPNKRALLSYIRENVNESKKRAMLGLSRTSFDYNWDLNAPEAQLSVVNAGE